jgi:hypothetical protein
MVLRLHEDVETEYRLEQRRVTEADTLERILSQMEADRRQCRLSRIDCRALFLYLTLRVMRGVPIHRRCRLQIKFWRVTFLRRVAAASAVLVVPLLFVGGGASASTTCISDNGSNVNAYFGIEGSAAIWLNLQGLQPACRTVVKGDTFYRVTGWITEVPPGTKEGNTTIKPVYPNQYKPDFRAPMDDFLSKLVQERFVISDRGPTIITTVGRSDLLAHGKLGTFGDLFVAPDTTLVPGVTIVAGAPEWTTVEPLESQTLSVGEHTINVYWTLAKQHCDGFTSNIATSCLPAGESLVSSTTFSVVAP